MDPVIGFIKVLLDKAARVDERDDAAMDLGEYNDERALHALIQVGLDPLEDDMILNSCGESIGSIWLVRNQFDRTIYRSLPGTTRHGVYLSIKSRQPEWIATYRLDSDNFMTP